MEKHLLQRENGGTLEILTQGESSDTAFIFLHGAFGSAINMGPLFRSALKYKIFCIGITRPGYADSTRREGRRASNYVMETKIVLDHFGINSFVSFGWSSGAPAAISDTQDSRCKGAIIIAGDAPRTSSDWNGYLDKYPTVNYVPNPESSEVEEGEIDYEAWRNADLISLPKYIGEGFSPKDLVIFNLPEGDEFITGIRHGMSQSNYGAIDDIASDHSDWGIDLGSIEKPIHIFHGDEDRMNSPAHAHYLADNLSNSELQMLKGEGHISLIFNYANQLTETGISILRSI
jgi:pimeloyl-ACP methyl ester carboxylesterase